MSDDAEAVIFGVGIIGFVLLMTALMYNYPEYFWWVW